MPLHSYGGARRPVGGTVQHARIPRGSVLCCERGRQGDVGIAVLCLFSHSAVDLRLSFLLFVCFLAAAVVVLLLPLYRCIVAVCCWRYCCHCCHCLLCSVVLVVIVCVWSRRRSSWHSPLMGVQQGHIGQGEHISRGSLDRLTVGCRGGGYLKCLSCPSCEERSTYSSGPIGTPPLSPRRRFFFIFSCSSPNRSTSVGAAAARTRALSTCSCFYRFPGRSTYASSSRRI